MRCEQDIAFPKRIIVRFPVVKNKSQVWDLFQLASYDLICFVKYYRVTRINLRAWNWSNILQ